MPERTKKPELPKRRRPAPPFGNPNEPVVDGPEPDPDAPTPGDADEIEEIDDQTDDGDE